MLQLFSVYIFIFLVKAMFILSAAQEDLFHSSVYYYCLFNLKFLKTGRATCYNIIMVAIIKIFSNQKYCLKKGRFWNILGSLLDNLIILYVNNSTILVLEKKKNRNQPS